PATPFLPGRERHQSGNPSTPTSDQTPSCGNGGGKKEGEDAREDDVGGRRTDKPVEPLKDQSNVNK
ncbi:hypothetical protein A4X09_0g6876, partial [Tilletia walkeri]